jgi:hypothetical protein
VIAEPPVKGGKEPAEAEPPAKGGKEPANAEPAPAPKKKRKRKYKRGSIAGWMRPPLDDDSEDEGNDLDEWEEKHFRDICECEPRPYSTAECTCGCLVFYTRAEWRKHKRRHGLAPPGGWAKWK